MLHCFCYTVRMKKFTEKDTRDFYNTEDALYRSLWDVAGNCHWGYFLDEHMSFADATSELNKKMLNLARISPESSLLDLGCGNGVNTFFIHEETGATVTGVDLSDTRIQNAQKDLLGKEKDMQDGIKFLRGSAEKLPFRGDMFSHVWSQATLYHVHNKKKALKEIYRVLREDGIFIFDDLIKPNKTVSKDAQKLIYDRLLFDTKYDFVSYQEELKKLGFRVLYAEDMSWHLGMSYLKLADSAEEKIKNGESLEFHKAYEELISVYRQTWNLMEGGDIGWALFVCQKI